ncbi:hypothetical protein CRG98_007656 [Punica granatum]|uniref:Uncharacterized protein n=1 Tax=Punica granatum TaxID=22663 RepID=A0A2I0KUF8_PUNGR|nr:hypothetical protein CRG98_007656 [Punica granatum]
MHHRHFSPFSLLRFFQFFTCFICIFQENLGEQSSRNHCKRNPQPLKSREPLTLHQNITGSLRESRFFPTYPVESILPSRRDPQSLGNLTQLAPPEKTTPINRYSPDKPDCQSSLPVNLTAPIRGYIEAEEAAMTRESQGKPSTPLLKRVVESFHWLPHVTDGLLLLI